MLDNPFAAPSVRPTQMDDSPAGSGPRGDLLMIAQLQKWLLCCMAFQIVAVAVIFGPTALRPQALGGAVFLQQPSLFETFLSMGTWIAVVSQLAIAWMLSSRVYRFLTGMSVGLLTTTLTFLPSLLTIVPLVNLIPMFFISFRATKVLRDHGIKVGWLGANLAELKAALSKSNPPVVS